MNNKMTTLERTIVGLAQLGAAGARGGMSLARQANRAAKRAGRNVTRTRNYGTLTITRAVAPNTFTLVAGEAAGNLAPVLSWAQTSDLTAMYDQYKLVKVRIRLIPRYDPAQSGVTNNSDVWVAMACDPTGQVTAPTWAQVAAFSNAKVAPLVAGREFSYTFKPKATNSLSAGNYAVNESDWIILSAGGINVPHNNLIYDIKSGNSSAVTAYDYVLEYTIVVRSVS